jgi:Hemerythrin HHE cation binding domain
VSTDNGEAKKLMNTTPRLDLYAVIHKALRLALADSLTRLGSLDVADVPQRRDVIAQLHTLLDLCRSHVDKENRYVHPAIEARCPGISAVVAGEHEQHLATIDALEADVVAFQCAPDAAAAARLYRRLALFVAENLEHMETEETVHNAALWAAYSDEELLQVHHAILASIDADTMGQVLHWMLPAMNAEERAGMLGEMRNTAPAPAFDAVMQLAQRRLPAGEWAKLERALSSQVPQALAA